MILHNHTSYPGKSKNSQRYHSRQPSKNDPGKDHNHASYLGKSENSTKQHILKESDTDPPLSGKYTRNQWNNKNFQPQGVPQRPPSRGPPLQTDPYSVRGVTKMDFWRKCMMHPKQNSACSIKILYNRHYDNKRSGTNTITKAKLPIFEKSYALCR